MTTEPTPEAIEAALEAWPGGANCYGCYLYEKCAAPGCPGFHLSDGHCGACQRREPTMTILEHCVRAAYRAQFGGDE
jgi:hypothetical protein